MAQIIDDNTFLQVYQESLELTGKTEPRVNKVFKANQVFKAQKDLLDRPVRLTVLMVSLGLLVLKVN